MSVPVGKQGHLASWQYRTIQQFRSTTLPSAQVVWSGLPQVVHLLWLWKRKHQPFAPPLFFSGSDATAKVVVQTRAGNHILVLGRHYFYRRATRQLLNERPLPLAKHEGNVLPLSIQHVVVSQWLCLSSREYRRVEN